MIWRIWLLLMFIATIVASAVSSRPQRDKTSKIAALLPNAEEDTSPSLAFPPLALSSEGGSDRARIVDLLENLKKTTTSSNSRRPQLVAHVKASTLSLLLLILASNPFSMEAQFCRNLLLMTSILYLLESFFCSTRRYLSNVCAPNDIVHILDHLMESPPVAGWYLECYHFKHRRDSHLRDDEKIITHRASRHFTFQEWTDSTSKEEAVQSILQNYSKESRILRRPFVKIRLSKLLLFADKRSLNEYFSQQARFHLQQGNRDVHTDIYPTLGIEGFRARLLACGPWGGVVTGGGTTMRPARQLVAFWCFTLLGMTVPYRIWFSRYCSEVDVVIKKEVSVG